MHIAVTGVTGFIGRHLTRSLLGAGHSVIGFARGSQTLPPKLNADERFTLSTGTVRTSDGLVEAFEGCDAVAHLAGINFERGAQTFANVHVAGTNNVVEAAERAGVERLLLTSYLRARPNCGSGYLESKWVAEERVRASEIPGCVLKPAAVFGRGDQFLTGVARWLRTIPVVPTVGFRPPLLSPVSVADLVGIATTAVTSERLNGTTLAITGPTKISFKELIQIIGTIVDRRALVIPAPVWSQALAARVIERILSPPLITQSGVRMLSEGMTDPEPKTVIDRLPKQFRPETPLDHEQVKDVIGSTQRYGLRDLRI